VQIEAEQFRSTLLSSVSHDLRTPLAVIKGAATTLLDDDTGCPSPSEGLTHALARRPSDRSSRRDLLDMIVWNPARFGCARNAIDER